jgi:beta-lactamase superfamily II metal-dependent hydrolase
MAYEVDFLPVGDGKRSGDAIALRFGNLAGPRREQQVWIIDGGTRESGKALVEHVKKHYGTDRVDVVVSTHPDSDHASGLSVVLDEMTVELLLMHQPWKHNKKIQHFLDYARYLDYLLSSDYEHFKQYEIEKQVLQSLQDARQLEEIANKKSIRIIEPFSGNGFMQPLSSCKVYVLSPSIEFYEELLPKFRSMAGVEQKSSVVSMYELLQGKAKETARALETWFRETLADPKPDATSAENNSSVVLLFELDGQRLLFTADAGVPALTEAANRAYTLGIDLKTVRFIQVPHHGSKRNVGPTILNRILGPINGYEFYDKTAYISASKGGQPEHPAKKVVNAFKRRGANVFATQGKGLWYYSNDAPQREGWSAAQPLPFYKEVDE